MPKKNLVVIMLSMCILATVSTCCLISYFLSPAYANSIYATLPKFSRLNAQILDELKPPDGVEDTTVHNLGYNRPEFQVSFSGLTYRYDLSLNERYEVLNPSETSKDKITAYYKDLFQAQGWKQYSQNEEEDNTYYNFYRGTACAQLRYFKVYQAGRIKYKLTIGHDLWKQSFSAIKPPEFLMWRFYSYPCPP